MATGRREGMPDLRSVATGGALSNFYLMPRPKDPALVKMIAREIFGDDSSVQIVERVNVVGPFELSIDGLGSGLIL